MVRRVHGFVNCIMQDDAKRIRHMGQETQPRNTDSVRLGIGQQVYGDGLRWQRKAKVALDYRDDVVFRKFGRNLPIRFSIFGLAFAFQYAGNPTRSKALSAASKAGLAAS